MDIVKMILFALVLSSQSSPVNWRQNGELALNPQPEPPGVHGGLIIRGSGPAPKCLPSEYLGFVS